MGTLLRLEPVPPRLAAALGVELATAERAFHAEVAYYLEHQLEAVDTEALADLRRRCGTIVAREAGVDEARGLPALMESLEFAAFDDAAPALEELRALGLRLVAVSNWDCGLPEVLERVGLLDLLDGVVTSAGVGAAKPDPRPFEVALRIAACGPDHALHVGDSPEADVAGAEAMGIRGALLDRDADIRGAVLDRAGESSRGGASAPTGASVRITSLAELPALLS